MYELQHPTTTVGLMFLIRAAACHWPHIAWLEIIGFFLGPMINIQLWFFIDFIINLDNKKLHTDANLELVIADFQMTLLKLKLHLSFKLT